MAMDAGTPPPPEPDTVAPTPSFALGVGLTNACNLACSFCYRDPDRLDRLGPEQLRTVLDSLPVRSVNLGTGENGMHPQFPQLLDLLRAEPIKLTITSNGHSIAVMDDAAVRAFADVEFSIDYPTREEQDAQRGAGNWDLVMAQAARCRTLGVGVTFIAVMMRTNFDRLHEIAALARGFNAPLRINVYQAVRTDTFALTYEEYWDGFARLFAETDVIAIGEPLVRAMAGLPARRGGCGIGTVRVTPRATVQPCVYWGDTGQSLDTLREVGSAIVATAPFAAVRALPEPCRGCAHEESCHGGCAGRRRLMERLDQVDPYCPIVRGEIRPLSIVMAPARELPKLESACTTIVQARPARG
jgi:radical SAM protein with 4Fe4S-binding SPASM domain